MKKQRFLRILMIAMLFLMVSSVSNLHAGDCDECNKQKAGGATGTGIYNRTEIDGIAALAWTTSVEEIDRNQTIALSVSGGDETYTWTVEGTDFTLASSTTTDGSNQLTAGASSAGSATIKVKDSYNQEVTGYVRCSTGRWSLVDIGSFASCGCWFQRTISDCIFGKFRKITRGSTTNQTSYGNCCKKCGGIKDGCGTIQNCTYNSSGNDSVVSPCFRQYEHYEWVP